MPTAPLIIPFEGVTPNISKSAWVAPNATIIGRVKLGERSSVFYGAVLRGDVDSIELGAGSNLQDNVTVHCDSGIPTKIGAGVSVGHAAVLHGCTIEDDCLIGMSATVLNHAVVGAGSLVAAGSVVLEGAVIPPGSLVAGVPAKVHRVLTAAEHERIIENAKHYLRISGAHRAITSA
jgi:carbonic anhydrase/acetyltransferase-like protein (isoleucine patch superfamily)